MMGLKTPLSESNPWVSFGFSSEILSGEKLLEKVESSKPLPMNKTSVCYEKPKTTSLKRPEALKPYEIAMLNSNIRNTN